MKTALAIAGSDSCGGAGIQADIKTMTMNGVYAMTAVTALTAQNTTGVADIAEVTPEFLAKQIEAVFEDIRPDAVKIGMTASAELITVIAEKLETYHAEHIVVDPVMVSTSGARLMKKEAAETLTSRLLPLAEIVTPNIPEAEILSGLPIKSRDDMCRAAGKIAKTYRCSVLLKGGHAAAFQTDSQTGNQTDSQTDARERPAGSPPGASDDLLYREGTVKWIRGERIDNPNTHGTGCTLSSAIAANLAKGYDLEMSVKRAKDYLSGALGAMLDLGKGSGPVNHAYKITE